MKYALIKNIRSKALKGRRGVCPHCNSEVIAKCGELKVNHWAHMYSKNCDSWWEPETEWHRSWKAKFPTNWQEVTCKDEKTKEKHIADVFTKHGLVVEFQHSHIKPEDQRARENFYQNMVWVVDGTRLKRDYPRFKKADIVKTNRLKIYAIRSEKDCFPPSWIDRKIPVVFDFLGTDELRDKKDLRKNLYCLFPKLLGEVRVFAEISRRAFINSVINGFWASRIDNMDAEIDKENQKIAKREAHLDEKLRNIIENQNVKALRQNSSTRRRRRKRRF